MRYFVAHITCKIALNLIRQYLSRDASTKTIFLMVGSIIGIITPTKEIEIEGS